MYICESCGKLVSDGEISAHKERGEYWGTPFLSEVSCCPVCGGGLVEAKECTICGEWIKDGDWDICEECLEKEKTKDNCFEIGKENEETFNINGFIFSAFSKDEIEQILLKYLENDEQKMKKAVQEYCEYDMSYFVDWVGAKWYKKK